VDRKPEVAQQREVPNEDAIVKPVKGRKRRYSGKKPATGQHGEPKKLTRGDCGSWMKLAAACRKVSRRATVAWRKRNSFRISSTQRNHGPPKEVTTAGIKITRCAGHRRMEKKEDNAEQETPKRSEENRCWKYPERNTGIRDRGLKQRLRGSKQTKDPTMNDIEGWSQGKRAPQGIGGIRRKDIYEISSEKIMDHAVGTSSGLPKIRKWHLWRGRPPPKRKRNNG
jgi:hypothetical protein